MMTILGRVRANPATEVLLYADECTFHRPPTQGYLWHAMGRRQPPLRFRGDHGGVAVRVVGYLDAHSAALHAHCVPQATVPALQTSVAAVVQRYPHAQKLYLVWDNWPNHHHPALVATLAQYPQVEVVPLPTYAPWLNPIEKAWRWLRQRVTHGHNWAAEAAQLAHHVHAELDILAAGSPALLRYVGLSI